MSLGLELNLQLTDVKVGRKIHKGNLLLLRFTRHRQLLGLKTKQTMEKEERKIGVEVEMSTWLGTVFGDSLPSYPATPAKLVYNMCKIQYYITFNYIL